MLLDLLPALVVVHLLQRQVDVASLLVDAEDLAHDLLSLTDVVSNVLDPSSGDIAHVDEALPAIILVE